MYAQSTNFINRFPVRQHLPNKMELCAVCGNLMIGDGFLCDGCGSVTDNNNNYVQSDHTYSVPSLNCLKDREYENRKQFEQTQTTI